MTDFDAKTIKVYLDQKDWINLARAYYERPDGKRYKAVLKKVLETIESKAAIFPLSATHVIETNKRRNLDSRKRLASVMAAISQGNTIAHQASMAMSELNCVIAQEYGSKKIKNVPAFGIGIPFAFGVNYSVTDNNNDHVRVSGELDQIIHSALTDKGLLIRMLIGDDTKLGDRIKSLEENRDKYVKAGEEFRQKIRDYDKRLLKRAYMGNLILSLYNDLNRILRKYGQSIETFLKIGSDQLESFFARIPTLDTEIELATRGIEHWDKKIAGNDVGDITSLSVAIPYCDIVVTEVFWTNVAKHTGLGNKYNTQIISSLDELMNFLP